MKRGSMLGTRNRSVAEEDTAFDRVAVMPQTLRILVVEDLPATLMVTVELLGELGRWAAGVTSAKLALLRYLEGAFDVLMVDVGLPGLSGLDLAKKLEARGGLPVIFATRRPAPDPSPPNSFWLQSHTRWRSSWPHWRGLPAPAAAGIGPWGLECGGA